MAQNTSNKVALIFMLSLAFGAGFLYSTAKTIASAPASPATEKIAKPSENKDSEIARLRAENETLRKKLMSTTTLLSTQKSTSKDEGNAFKEIEKSNCEERLKALEQFASDANSKLMSKKIESIFSSPEGGANWVDRLEKEFTNEQPDPQWATEAQRKYIALFSQNSELEGLTLLNAECKSEQCKITVAASNIEESNSISDRVASALRKVNSPSNLMIAPDMQRNSTNLYVRRDGKGFEFN